MKILIVCVQGRDRERVRTACSIYNGSASVDGVWASSFKILTAWTDTNVNMTSSLNEIRWIL